MKKVLIATALVALATIVLVLGGTVVLAQEGKTPFAIVWSRQSEGDQGPDEVYTLDDYGIICVVDNGNLWCGCPCPTCENGVQTIVATGDQPSQTPPPPVVTTVPPPSATTPPPGTETPPPDETEEKCNQGLGNGSEGCDPGNSNNNQDSNDEPGGGRGNGNNH